LGNALNSKVTNFSPSNGASGKVYNAVMPQHLAMVQHNRKCVLVFSLRKK